MKNVLVTGGAGYIGSHVTERLIEKGYNVIIVDNLSSGSKKLINNKAKFFKINICNYLSLERIFINKIDYVIHLAASVSVPEGQKNPKKFYVNNVFGTQNLLDLCVKYKVKNFIFSSTCAVYGYVKGSASENFLKKPESFYGKTKDICEEMIKNYSKNYNLKFIILRYFNVIGASVSGKIGQLYSQSLFKNIARNIIKKNYKVNVFGNDYNTIDGTCVRDYIDVNDLAELHLLCIKINKNIILNCGYNKRYSILEIINKFSKIIKKKIKINFLKRRNGDLEEIYSNNKLLRKTFFNWSEKYDLEKSIKRTLSWEKKINVKKFR